VNVDVLPSPGHVDVDQHLWRALSQVGLTPRLVQMDEKGKAPILIVVNHSIRTAKFVRGSSSDADKRILILMEPRVTSPLAYVAQHRDLYTYACVASKHWVRGPDDVVFRWPVSFNLATGIRQPIAHPPWVSIINANKTSAMTGSLYRLRRLVIKALIREGISFVWGGHGWDLGRGKFIWSGLRSSVKALHARSVPKVSLAFGTPIYASEQYQGVVLNKNEFLGAAPMTIVIENSLDYVSEKLFDAVRAQVVPIYVGPDLASFGIPKGIALQVEPSVDSILSAIVNTNREQLMALKRSAAAWSASPAFKLHSAENVYAKLARNIAARL